MKHSAVTKLGLRTLVYLAIALGVLLLCALLVTIAIYTGHTREAPVGWFGLAGFTPVIFWAVLKSLRRRWKRRGFWFAVSALMLLHLLTFAGILLRYPRWPLLWFVPASFVEAGFFVVILGRLFDDNNARSA